jgi:RNA polymerase sigma-70 factor (ECF subfamily)
MEREAVRILFMQHYARMQRVARTLLYDVQESEDVCQDIFESLIRGETVLVPGTEERYLMTSVRNRCLKRLRHVAIEHSPLTIDHFAASNGTANNGEDSIHNGQCSMSNGQCSSDDRLDDIVEYVVSHLSAQEQRIFRLRFSEGYSYEEIAAAEGLSKVAVWKHLSHIITSIKKHFNPSSL